METGKLYTVRKMDQTGDSRCEMTLQEIQREVDGGMFCFVDTELVSSSNVSQVELEGVQEILLTARLVGG